MDVAVGQTWEAEFDSLGLSFYYKGIVRSVDVQEQIVVVEFDGLSKLKTFEISDFVERFQRAVERTFDAGDLVHFDTISDYNETITLNGVIGRQFNESTFEVLVGNPSLHWEVETFILLAHLIKDGHV